MRVIWWMGAVVVTRNHLGEAESKHCFFIIEVVALDIVQSNMIKEYEVHNTWLQALTNHFIQNKDFRFSFNGL